MVEFFQEGVNLGLASKENTCFIGAKGAQTRIRRIAEQRWGMFIGTSSLQAGEEGVEITFIQAVGAVDNGDLVW